jgi:hypothetical protein
MGRKSANKILYALDTEKLQKTKFPVEKKICTHKALAYTAISSLIPE